MDFFFLQLSHVGCRILVPWPGIEPTLPALGAWCPNHWTTKEVPTVDILSKLYNLYLM